MSDHNWHNWQPGDLLLVPFARGDVRMLIDSEGDGLLMDESGRVLTASDVAALTGVRRLAVIDPEDPVQVERLLRDYWGRVTSDYVLSVEQKRDAMQAALREFAYPAPPKPYREHRGMTAPWPVVDECQASHREDHECPQCAWQHEHDWVAWPNQADLNGIPIRCSKCGGRKCDHDECALRRHTHTHDAGVLA